MIMVPNGYEALDPSSLVFWTRIGAALLCGGLIGVERQLRGKPAGIRTSVLICMGTLIFVTLGVSFAAADADPTRVLGQVVTGIGFLGAGVILTREGIVVGVTSAAAIWLLAALGSAIALGYERSAIAFTLVALIVLIGVEGLEGSFASLRRGVHAWRSRQSGDQAE
jgi:putative Mg2+ transporter-C (MgtC) family protein